MEIMRAAGSEVGTPIVSLQLGQAANILYGYQPVWNVTSGTALPFFAPPVVSVVTSVPVFEAPEYIEWTNTPTVTIHNSADDLVSAIYHYNVLPLSSDPSGLDIPAGPLALDDADKKTAIASVGALLGLDLTLARGYVLVTMERVNGTATHEFIDNPSVRDRSAYLTDAASATISQLPPAAPRGKSVLYDSKITKDDGVAYLNAIYNLGSHFVSQIVCGDRLIQVFAYTSDKFSLIQTAFGNDATEQPDGTMAVTGSDAFAWAYYTSPVNGTFGFVSEYGNLFCVSGDPTLQTSITANKWVSSYTPGKASIFAAENYALLESLQMSVAISVSLTSIAALIRNPLVSGPWDRLVKGALLQKFGDEVTLPLSREVNYDWSSIFPQTTDAWASNIVTPTVDIYQELVDLAEVQLLGGDIVAQNFKMKSFTSFSQVLMATTKKGADPIALPSDNVTLIAQIIDTTLAEETPVVSMSTAALGKLNVVCETMYGALIFEGNGSGVSNRKVALDGLLYATDPNPDPDTQRYKVSLSGVLSDTPSASLITSVKDDIGYSIVAGESLLQSYGTGSDTVCELEEAYLLWLANIIPADTTDPELARDRSRALYLANDIATFGSTLVYVPYVTYETYSKYVNDMVEVAENLNGQIMSYQTQITSIVSSYLVMDSIANLNANVKQIGGALTSFFKVLADGRNSMNGYYDSIASELQKELTSTLANIQELQKELSDEQSVISHTGDPVGIVQQFEQDYADYQKDLVAQCVVSAVTAMFDLGLAMAGIPEAAEGGVLKALEALKKLYESIHAVMEVLEQIEAIESVTEDAAKLNELSDTIAALSANGDIKMPSQVDLQLMAEDVRAALTNVPDTGSLNQDKANLIAAVDSLAIIGGALLDAQAKASQILVQIANNNYLKTINAQQAQDMTALENSLHLIDSKAPDINSINLIGVTGQLQFQLKQVLLVLTQTLELQNGAVLFEYFGQPATITSFSLLNLLTVIATQDRNIINALQHLDPMPQKVDDPVVIKIPNVIATKVSGTNIFEFTIPLSDTRFYCYDMVRIDRVVPNISGIKSTKTGKYEISLSCQGKPFQDRDYNRNAMTYGTINRNFGPYVYDIATGKAEFGTNTGSFADQVTHLTPFTTWRISLSNKVRNNQEIQFDSLMVDIEMDFYITAHYDDPVERTKRLLAALRRKNGLHEVLSLNAPYARRSLNGRGVALPRLQPTELLAMANAATPPTLSTLESQMYQNQEVLQGWDAVFSVLSGPVNAFLFQQFQTYIKTIDPDNTDNLMPITTLSCDSVSQFHGSWFTNVTYMDFKLSNPLLEFIPGNDCVSVDQYIVSGTMKTGTLGCTQTGFTPTTCILPPNPVAYTVDSTGLITIQQASLMSANMQVVLATTGTCPAPFNTTTEYWVVNWSTTGTVTTFQLSLTPGGTPIAVTAQGTGTQTIAADVYWGDTMTVDTSNHPYVHGSVSLASISGIVTPPTGQGSSTATHTVYLDFPTGAFTLNQFAVDPPNWDPAHHATEISNALANYYATNEIKYQVQTINYTNLSQDVNLQPSQFLLDATTTTAGNNILQIYIATTGGIDQRTSTLINEPIPYDASNPIPGESDFTTSLMVSSELMFNDIFVSSFNKGGTNLQVTAVEPAIGYQAWSAQVTQGSATGTVNFKDSYVIDGTTTQFRISSSGNDISWSLVGLTFNRSPSSGVSMSYSNQPNGTNVDFQYRTEYYVSYGEFGGEWKWTDWTDSSATAYITMTGNYPLAVFGDGSAQQIKFTTTLPAVTFDKSSDLKPNGACECSDNDIKIALMNALGESVPSTLQTYMDQITFTPISVFALENLLFPADQLITMKQAVVPGDLLVVGSFLSAVRTKNATYNVTISAASGAQGVFGNTSFQNGVGSSSATVSGLPASFNFTYGPLSSTVGSMVAYTINIETGTLYLAGTTTPASLMVVVVQPDPVNHPADVILLPPNYPIPSA
jgi:hypothetical protein